MRDTRDGQNLSTRKFVSRARNGRRGNQEGCRSHAAKREQQNFPEE
jgi:hypothetical protein